MKKKRKIVFRCFDYLLSTAVLSITFFLFFYADILFRSSLLKLPLLVSVVAQFTMAGFVNVIFQEVQFNQKWNKNFSHQIEVENDKNTATLNRFLFRHSFADSFIAKNGVQFCPLVFVSMRKLNCLLSNMMRTQLLCLHCFT